MEQKSVLHFASGGEGEPRRILFFCPACGEPHAINDTWYWNGDEEKPTFHPLVLVTGGKKTPGAIAT